MANSPGKPPQKQKGMTKLSHHQSAMLRLLRDMPEASYKDLREVSAGTVTLTWIVRRGYAKLVKERPKRWSITEEGRKICEAGEYYEPPEEKFKAQYHRYRELQPRDRERWTSAQFQKWVEDYGYPRNLDAAVIPYDVKRIADDLKCATGQVYSYWRGHDGNRVVTVPPPVVALCKALLLLKLLREGET